MDQWTNGPMDQWTNEWTNEWTDEWTNERTSGPNCGMSGRAPPRRARQRSRRDDGQPRLRKKHRRRIGRVPVLYPGRRAVHSHHRVNTHTLHASIPAEGGGRGAVYSHHHNYARLSSSSLKFTPPMGGKSTYFPLSRAFKLSAKLRARGKWRTK